MHCSGNVSLEKLCEKKKKKKSGNVSLEKSCEFKSLQSRVSARLSAHKPSVLDLGEVVKQKSKSKSKAKNKSKAKGLRGSV